MDQRDKILSNVQRGDLLFFTSKGIISWIIQWTTSSKINHVAVYIGDGKVLESQNDTGVAIRDLEYYFNFKDEKIQIGRVKNITKSKLEKVIQFASNKIGDKYDYWGLLGIFLKYMVKKLGLTKIITFYGRNKAEVGKEYWCSEFWGAAFLSQGIKFVDHDISYLTPSEMFNSPTVEHII